MAETANVQLRKPVGTDPFAPRSDIGKLADDVDAILGRIESFAGDVDTAPTGIANAGRLAIVQNTGGPAYKAMSGDGTIDANGVLTLAANSVGSAEIAPNSVGMDEVDENSVLLGANLDTTDGRLRLTSGLVSASADRTLTGAYQDITGATVTFTPDVAAHALVLAAFDFDWVQFVPGATNELGSELAGTLTVDGVAQTKQAKFGGGVSVSGTQVEIDGRATVHQIYRVALTAASHTLKLQARMEQDFGMDQKVCRAAGTQFLYALVAQ